MTGVCACVCGRGACSRQPRVTTDLSRPGFQHSSMSVHDVLSVAMRLRAARCGAHERITDGLRIARRLRWTRRGSRVAQRTVVLPGVKKRVALELAERRIERPAGWVTCRMRGVGLREPEVTARSRAEARRPSLLLAWNHVLKREGAPQRIQYRRAPGERDVILARRVCELCGDGVDELRQRQGRGSRRCCHLGATGTGRRGRINAHVDGKVASEQFGRSKTRGCGFRTPSQRAPDAPTRPIAAGAPHTARVTRRETGRLPLVSHAIFSHLRSSEAE